MPSGKRSAAVPVAKVFLCIFLAALLTAGSGTPVGADTYGLSSGNPAVTFFDTINITDPNETRGINYFGTGTVKNYGSIITATTGGLGFSTGIYFSVPSPILLYNGGSITATASANDALSYGIGFVRSNSVTNEGSITVSATGVASAFSSGIYTENSLVSNSGSIRASSTAPTFDAYGIRNENGFVSNSGTVSATGVGSTGNVYGVYTVSGGFTNSGTVSASGTGATVIVYGAFSPSGVVTNSGTISASGSSTGLLAVYAASIGAGLTSNSGTISATANGMDARAWGFEAAASSISNSGTISVDSSGFGNISARAVSATDSVITNSGVMSARAQSSTLQATAYGILENGAGDISITNSGNITATAIGDAATSAKAYGIYTNNTVTNTGSITAYARGGAASAYGIFADAGAAVSNSGRITVSADGASADAHGIYFNNGGTLTNTGIIWTPSSDVCEVHVKSGTLDIAGRYNMTLDGNHARASVFLDGFSVVNLNNARFSVSDAPDTRFNTEYRIFGGTGTVNGAFGSVAQPPNPSVSVLYHDKGTATSADDTVSLSYNPRTSPYLEGVNIGRHLLSVTLNPVRQQQVNKFLEGLLSGTPIQLAANDTVAGDAPAGLRRPAPGNNAYVIPYYARLNKSSDSLGYKAGMTGFTAGYDRHFDGTQLGFHLGYGYADADYSGSDFPAFTKDRQDLYSLGVRGMTRWGNWTLRGDLTGFRNHHSSQVISGMNFEGRETADYAGGGTTENLLGGYAFKAGSHVFHPEIGLSHIWVRQEGFRPSSVSGWWQTDNSSVNNNLFQSLASIRWLSSFSLLEIPVTTSLALGGLLRINNDDLVIQQSVMGSSPITVTAGQDRSAMTASFSLAVKKNGFTSELAYNGEYSGCSTMHAVWMKFSWLF